MGGHIVKEMNETLMNLFGTMFFIALTPMTQVPPKDEWEQPSLYVQGKVNVQAKGKELPISLYFPEQLAKEITINFLGIEAAEFDEEKMLDSIQEATNMTVGGLLGKIDPKAFCSIGIPVAKKCEDFNPESIMGSEELRVYRTDAGLLWVACSAFEMCDTRCN